MIPAVKRCGRDCSLSAGMYPQKVFWVTVTYSRSVLEFCAGACGFSAGSADVMHLVQDWTSENHLYDIIYAEYQKVGSELTRLG